MCPTVRGGGEAFGGVGIAQPQLVEEQGNEDGQGAEGLACAEVTYQDRAQGRGEACGQRVGDLGVVGGRARVKAAQGEDLCA